MKYVLAELNDLSAIRKLMAKYHRDTIAPEDMADGFVTTALSDEQFARLTQKLEGMTGKTVLLTNRQDPDCLGGVRLELDGECIDDTVMHRLESLRHLLKNTVL